MKTKAFTIILFLFASFLIGGNTFAQDSTDTEKHDWKWDWEFDDFEEWMNFGQKMPSISFGYGLTSLDSKRITEPVADANLVNLKLGHTTRKTSKYAENILKYSYSALALDYFSNELTGSSNNANELSSKTWRIGLSNAKGYGYKIDNAAIIPYFSTSFDWSWIDFTNPALTPNDQKVLNRIEEGVRFGTSNESGIKIVAASLVTFDVGYERSIVFERHLFWKWAGSGIIEAASQGLLDIFIKEIMKSSPDAGPIVYFVLKSALGYGIYELRQEKMNWPFKSAAPLASDSFKFGVTFTF